MNPLEQYHAFLLARDKRLTPEKSHVVAAVFARTDPFRADEFVDQLSREQVSRSTVFRCLAELENAGLIERTGETAGDDILYKQTDSD